MGINMRKSYIGTFLACFALCSAACHASGSPLSAGYTYADDSDGIKTYSYKLSTAAEGRPFSLDLYRTRIRQNQTDLTETTVIAKAQRALSDHETLTLWGGYSKNEMRHFVPAALMYNARQGDNSLWLSAGREAVGTVEASRDHIYYNTLSASYMHRVGEGKLLLEAAQYNYSDDNQRRRYSLTYSQEINPRLKAGLRYGYDSADSTRPGKYYVPQDERVLSIVPEWTIPINSRSKWLITGEISLSAHDSTGSIRRHGAEVGLMVDSLYVGTKYYRSGDYWSRVWRLSYTVTM